MTLAAAFLSMVTSAGPTAAPYPITPTRRYS